MYEKFFRLNQNPFQINTDPKFLWLGKKHKEALATLQYGVLDNKSFLLLTGDIGTGKTTLINALLKLHSQDTLIATIKDPRLPPLELFNYIAYSYGIKKHFTSKSEFLIAFEQFLQKQYYQSKKVLLIIDESQRFQQETLEEIRCLSNIEIGGNKLIHIYFIGQNEFNAILAREENKAISQRITVSYNIQPLTEDEVAQYIEHRLTVAGGHKTIFDKNALKEIASCSKGYPRLINILCDRCLLTGFVQGQKT
ncbi:MAG: AAA family ATPase, partial [Desulfobulbaceae bacterium]|nr:AAA family ATPase [Desulfobulbaceae bacterium]